MLRTDWTGFDFTGMVLINGWYFDFYGMQAYRDPQYRFYDKDEIGNKQYICYIAQHDEVLRRRIAADQLEFRPFFDHPEDGFNKVITDKYKEVMIERVIWEE